MSIIAILLRKWCPNKKHFAELDLQHGGKTDGIDIWRNYDEGFRREAETSIKQYVVSVDLE